MPDIYRAADCAVMPALWPETYSYYLREALACGCLAAASRLGALPEPVTEGKNGFLFASGDVEDLKNALSRALAFDLGAYEQAAFPTPAMEAEQYERIYVDAAFN